MTTAYGRIETKGQSTVKEFESPKVARIATKPLIEQNAE
jgi:predicted DNA-binding WGR domain protein